MAAVSPVGGKPERRVNRSSSSGVWRSGIVDEAMHECADRLAGSILSADGDIERPRNVSSTRQRSLFAWRSRCFGTSRMRKMLRRRLW